MANKREDVELGVAVNVTNAERVKSLSNDLKQLADQGTLATADFERLNNEVKELGTQASAVSTLANIEGELRGTTDALAQATAKADALGATLREQTSRVEDFKAKQQAAAAELRSTKEALIAQELALSKLNAEYSQGGKRGDEYKNSARGIKLAIAELEATLDTQRLAVRDANAAFSAANKELSATETAARKASKAVDELNASAAKQSQALTAASAAVKALGVDSTSAANAEAALAAALDRVTKASVETVAAAEKRAAIEKAVAESNVRNVALAQKAADARAAADAQAQARAEALAVAMQKLAFANEAVEASEREIANQARLAGEAVQQALGNVGVRSAAQIRAEIAQVRDSIGVLRSSGELTGRALEDAARKAAAQVNALELELRQVTSQLTVMDRAKLGFNALAEGANNLIGRFGALGAAVGTVVFALKPFFDTAIQFDSLRRSLTAVTGSVAEAERMIGFLRETANKAGVSVASISDSFLRFNASARSSGLSAQVVQDVFSRTAIAAGNLGISSDKLGLILDALSQMANKGVVSMEELRQQLGDSLPGALSLLAKGLGVSEAELVKLVETGRVLTADALPALADAFIALQPAGGEVQGLSASFNRLKNAITETTQVATQGGGFNGLVAVLKLLGGAVLGAYTGFMQLVEVLTLGVTVMLRTGEAITTFSLGPLRQLAEESDAARTRISNLGGVFSSYVRSANEAAVNTTAAGNAVAQAGAQAQIAATGHNTNAQAQTAAASAATSNASAQAGSGGAAAAAGAQANAASNGWYALQLSVEQTTEAQEKSILNAETYAKAAKIEGDTRNQLAQLAGDQAAIVRTAAEAAQLESEKLAEVARIRQQGLEVLQRERDALVEEAARLGTANKERQAAIDKLNALIAARTAESEKANQSAEAARLETLARETAAKTYADNSAKLDSLKSTYEQTVRAVMALTEAVKAGTATQSQLDAVREKSARAEALYRDAVRDSAAAVEIKNKALQSSLSVTTANIEVAKARLDTEILMRKSIGDTSALYLLEIEKKQLDLQVSREKISVMRQEIALAKEQLEKDREAIALNDPLRAQKLEEIEIRRQSIRAKELEIQRQEQLAKQTERQIQLDQQRGATSLNASSQTVDGLEREISARERANALAQRAIDLENKRRGVDAKGFSTDTTGQTVNMEMPTWLSAFNMAKSFGVDEANARMIADKYFDQQGNWRPGDQRGYETWSAAVRRSAEEVVRSGSSSLNPGPSTSPTAPASTPAQGSMTTYRVDIALGGGAVSTVNTASDADARKLVNTLQTIASRTAG